MEPGASLPLSPPSSTAPSTVPESSTSSDTSTSAAKLPLPSAMKTPSDSFDFKQGRLGGVGAKRAAESPRGSLRFLLPVPIISVREVDGDEEERGGGRASDEECDGDDGDDSEDEEEDDDNDAASQRSLLGARRGGRRKRRRLGGRREAAGRWWRDWKGTVVLWIVLVVLGSAMGFVFVENAEDEGPEVPDFPEPGPGPGPGLGESRFGDVTADTTTDRDKLIQSRNGAVSSDVEICSQIGVMLMKKGGNAVDAVIGTTACIGTINMFASGVGGGGFAVVRAANGESTSFNFREMAPGAAHRDMYNGNPLLAQRGGLAFAIPGEVDGFWRLHQKYGNLPWNTLWAPAIKLAQSGFPVTEVLAARIAEREAYFEAHRGEWGFLFDESTGRALREGETMRRPALARTFRAIAGRGGVGTFYGGWIAESLVRAANGAGGVVVKEDFGAFYTVVEETVKARAFGREFVSCQSPCSGPVLVEALNIAEGLNLTDPSDNVTIHRMVETMKWMSAGRTELGDPTDTEVFNGPRVQEIMTPAFAKSVRQNISDSTTYPWKHYNPSYEPNEPKGTSHINVLDQFGNAAALTTTVNLYWGALVHDTHTGIVLNSEMDDFSIPGKRNAWNLAPSVYNYIKPRKRPLSSTAPTISAEKDGKPGMVIGASGGSRIVTSVFECILKSYLWGYDLLDVVKSPRIHHQLVPEVAYVERGVSEQLVEALRERGHTVQVEAWAGSVVGAVRRTDDGTIFAVADWWRKRGKAAGF